MNRKKIETIMLILEISVIIFFFLFYYLIDKIHENFVYMYIPIALIQIILLHKCEILLLKYPKKRIEIKEKKTGVSNSFAYESIENYLNQKYKLEVENKKQEQTIRFYKNKSILSVYTKFVALIKCTELDDGNIQYLERQIYKIDKITTLLNCDFKIIIVIEKSNQTSEEFLKKNMILKTKAGSIYGKTVNPIIINDGKIYLSGCDPTNILVLTYYHNYAFYKKIFKIIKKKKTA
ncbi:MAG: hypothetical protein IKM55_04485 [Bacilli bacterium]|nr:hypothetical protein [Bacilli bacterium]